MQLGLRGAPAAQLNALAGNSAERHNPSEFDDIVQLQRLAGLFGRQKHSSGTRHTFKWSTPTKSTHR